MAQPMKYRGSKKPVAMMTPEMMKKTQTYRMPVRYFCAIGANSSR
jgi:hypothetical protein